MFGARQRATEELEAAQTALRTANSRIESILESLSDGICAVDHEWRITYLNGQALQMLAPPEKTREHLLGQPLWDEFADLDQTPFAVACRAALQEGRTVSAEMYYPRRGGWIGVRAYPAPEGLTIYVQDITQHKTDQQALVDGNARLQLALSAGGLGDWCWDAATDRVTLGARAAAMFTLPADVPLDWSALRERLDEPSREQVRRAFLHAFATQADVDVECRLLADTGPLWIALVGRADYSDPGPEHAVAGMTGVVQDITARKHAEESLRQSEEVLRALANSIPQLAFMAGADGAIVWLNERWYQYTGVTPADAAGWGWERVLDPEVLPAVQEHWQHCLRTGEPFEMEYPIRGADGRYRWFLTRINAVRDLHGRVVRWFGTNTDVDEVKRAEQALRDESHVLELLNSTGAAMAATRELRTLLATATDAAAGIAGARFGAFFYHGPAGDGRLFTLYTMAGATPAQFQSFGEHQAMALFGPSMFGTGPLRASDITHERRDELHWFGLAAGHPAVRSYLAVPVVARSGEILGTMFFGHPEPGVFSDRTERIVAGIAAQAAIAIDNSRLYEGAQQAAEERKVLLEREREARAEAERTSQMKDEFLATLSHELRTPLSAILGWAQVLRRGGRDGGDLARGLQTIERNARAQAQLIEDLLDMSRITSGKVLLDMQVLAPASFIDAAIDTVRPGAEAKNITIEKHYAPDPGLVAADPGRLQQVVWNLLSNAIKFTPRDGKITVRLARRDGHVAITVSDTGAGIKPEFITHVFERFRQADASTTRRYGGLGLGLSIVKHLVEQHGGTVRADSAGEGQGASFTIELPLAKQQPARGRAGRGLAPLPTPATGELTYRDLTGVDVLVVDDDRDARELMARILTDCHAGVRTAAGAREGFSAFQAARPDILISDLGMPEVDGFELLGWVRALGREHGGNVPAIALTAFARSEDRLRALEAGFSAHISKPVEPSELIAAVAGIVGPASPLLLPGRAPRPEAS